MTNDHETTGEPGRIEILAAEYRRRAATIASPFVCACAVMRRR